MIQQVGTWYSLTKAFPETNAALDATHVGDPFACQSKQIILGPEVLVSNGFLLPFIILP